MGCARVASIALMGLLLVGVKGQSPPTTITVGEATIVYPEGRRGAAWPFHDAYGPARARVLQVTGALPPEGLKIVLVQDGDALHRRVWDEIGHDLPGWVAGVALPHKNQIIIRMDLHRSDAHTRVQGILIHELCHIVAHARLAGPGAAPLPRWLDEGIAQYAEGQPFNPDVPNLPRRAFFGQLLSFDDLTRAFPRSEGASSLAYAQSSSFVTFLARLTPNRSLAPLLDSMAEGVPADEAIETVFLEPLASLEARWRRELKSDKSWIPDIAGQVFVVGFLLIAVVLGATRIVKRRQAIEALWEMEDGNGTGEIPDMTQGEISHGDRGGSDVPSTLRRGVVRPRHYGFPSIRRIRKDETEPPV
jgi:hypothetical protein